MKRHVADLHCDLLCYLRGDPVRTPYEDVSRCSVSQLHAGQVRLQTMAIFCETEPGSSVKGMEQAEIFKLLPGSYPDDFQQVAAPNHLSQLLSSHRIGIVAAIENASSFCEEESSFEEGLEHLIIMFGKVGRPLYIGLTWNTENRFGGGAATTVGLKDDGRHLLDFLHGKQIAVDLSHASDQLAFDIFSYIDKKGLHVPILASHSNVRAVANLPRNLPDELIKEIFRRGGVIGINFVRPFIGQEPHKGFVEQLEAFLRLGGEDFVCFGADFFSDLDVPATTPGIGAPPDGWFFPEYGDASCYGHVLTLWRDKLGLSPAALDKIAYANLLHFISAMWEEAQMAAIRERDLDAAPDMG